MIFFECIWKIENWNPTLYPVFFSIGRDCRVLLHDTVWFCLCVTQTRAVQVRAETAKTEVKGETYEVTLQKPLQVKFARGQDGGAYVIQVVPGAVGYEDFEEGDKIVRVRWVNMLGFVVEYVFESAFKDSGHANGTNHQKSKLSSENLCPVWTSGEPLSIRFLSIPWRWSVYCWHSARAVPSENQHYDVLWIRCIWPFLLAMTDNTVGLARSASFGTDIWTAENYGQGETQRRYPMSYAYLRGSYLTLE